MDHDTTPTAPARFHSPEPSPDTILHQALQEVGYFPPPAPTSRYQSQVEEAQEPGRGKNYGRTRSWAEDVQQHQAEFSTGLDTEGEMGRGEEGPERGSQKDDFKTPTLRERTSCKSLSPLS